MRLKRARERPLAARAIPYHSFFRSPMKRDSMNSLWPVAAGMAPCLLALVAGQWQARGLRARCAQLQAALAAQRDTEMRLDFIAHHDSLTGLPNRLQFQMQLEHGVAYARRHESRLAVLFVDIDHFKTINDTLGHDAGDQVLVQFAQRLRQCVREVDTVARQGGDEFIVLLTELRSGADAQQVAEKIMRAIAEPFLVNGDPLPVAASIGVAVYPDDDADIESLIEKADLAMYAAKQGGKGASLRFLPSMQARAYSSLILETALRHAQQHNEFILTYQPKLNLREQKITGVKALLRWKHPELGLVMPLDFLPVLEQSSLILPVGAWVMATAAEQVRHWLERGHALTVALHLSQRQFFHMEIVQVFAATLEKAGVPGRCFELEITEAMLIDKGQSAEEILQQFKQLGVRIAISDFGTGYASLNYLRRFPVDVVKIDKSFVDDLLGGGAMVRAIIEMAHTLNMQVIAAGVESAEQLAQLTAMGCDEAFGFHLSAAVSPEEVEALLAGRQQRTALLTS